MIVGLDIFPLTVSGGGIARYTRVLAENLKNNQQLNIFYFTGLKWGKSLPPLTSMPLSSSQKFWNTSVGKIVRPFASSAYSSLSEYCAQKGSVKNKIDLFHETNFVAPRLNIPTILSVHDLSFIRFPETHPNERLKWLEKLPNSINRATHILTISEFSKQEIVKYYGVDPLKVSVTYMGVDDRFFEFHSETEINTIKAKYGLSDVKGYILSVGTLEPRKNLTILVDAYYALPSPMRSDYALVLVGAKGWKESSLLRKIESGVRAGNIRILGFVPDEDLAPLYAASKVFCFPSIYEGFGIPLIEAMATGVPIISSDSACMPEICGEHAIYCNPYDVKSWAVALQYTLEHSDENETKVQQRRDHAARYSWQICVKKTVDIYEKCLN